jgi:hypothetical protein
VFGRSTGAASPLFAFLIASVVAGCGSDGSGAPVEEPTEYGTCDRRASDYECLEVQAPESGVEKEKANCSGTWTQGTLACPEDSDLIGCCSYRASGGQYLECFYTGADEPMAYCDNVVHGYWQPPGF